MIKLTDTQMNVLTSACQRADGVAIKPAVLNRSAAVKVAAKLIERALAQEVPAKRDPRSGARTKRARPSA